MKYKYFSKEMPGPIHYANGAEVLTLVHCHPSSCDSWEFWAKEKGRHIVLDVDAIEEFCFENRREALLKALKYVDARSGAIRAELTCDAFRGSVPSAKVAAGRLFKYVKEGMK